MSVFDSYRDQVDRIIELVREQLDQSGAERIRYAVQNRHGDWEDFVVDQDAEHLAQRLIVLLADADKELTSEEVSELEQTIDANLPRAG